MAVACQIEFAHGLQVWRLANFLLWDGSLTKGALPPLPSAQPFKGVLARIAT